MKKIAIAVLLSSLVAQPAVADLYTGIKVGRVAYGYNGVTGNNQVGYGLLYGNTITKNFSVEGEFNTLGGYNTATDKVTGIAYSLSAIGFYPVKQHYSLFGKVGIVNSTLTATAKSGSGQTGSRTIHNAGLTVGFGARYNLSKEVGIRVGVDSYSVTSTASNTSIAHAMYICSVLKF